MSRGGWRGLTIDVATKLFESYSITFEDRKETEGSYVAIHPNGQIIRKGKVTDVTKQVIESWFQFID